MLYAFGHLILAKYDFCKKNVLIAAKKGKEKRKIAKLWRRIPNGAFQLHVNKPLVKIG